MSLNQFADRGERDVGVLEGIEGLLKEANIDSLLYKVEIKVPEAVDWRNATDKNGPIINQLDCGSCWAVAGNNALESALAIKTNSSV
jgi:C1A family cysteine protease